MKRRVMFAGYFWVMPAFAYGQSIGSVEEIVVTAARADDRVERSSVVLEHDALVELQPIGTADVFRNLTGISLRTNSRGESVVRVRGSEERQTPVFLDGTPLATPWDGRADLALLPAGLIDRIEISRGVVPIEYGANAVAGAIDLSTFVPSPGWHLQAEAQRGSHGLENLNAIGAVGLDNGWSYVVGASMMERDAERIANRNSVSFDPSPSDARSNTDLDGSSLYVATAYAGAGMLLRASVLHADVERGVAARGDLDPALSRPRFWRTPEWRMTQAMLNSHWDLRPNVNLRLTGWQQWFRQTIDAYTDYSYAMLQAREQGKDNTIGARATLSVQLKLATVRAVATAQESTHRQWDSAAATGSAADLVLASSQRFRQRLYTLGAEVDLPVSDDLISTFGLAVDRAETPLTGDKPAQDSLSAFGWSAGLRWTPLSRLSAAVTLGERSRFPTPRELYGAALGKFLLNPDLEPERALLADLSVVYTATEALSVDFAVWLNNSRDTLSQRAVMVDDVSRRQRYNTNGSLTYGAEVATTVYMAPSLRAEFSAAVQDGQIKRDNDGNRPELLLWPKAQLRAALDWQASARIDLRIEGLYAARAFDIAEDGTAAELPASTSVNLRGFVRIADWLGQTVQLTASVDNLTDELVLPQLGLPAPGRLVRVGIRIN